jgi:hypothetical protein
MKFAGFSFNKISAERLSGVSDKLKVNTKIDILKIDKFNSPTFEKDLLNIDFSYTLEYDPKFANLEFKGSILFYADPEEIKELLKDWKNQKLSEDFQTLVFNLVLKKTNVKALELEDELNLPFHIVMPTLKKKEEAEG